jgi:hypothetical protein
MGVTEEAVEGGRGDTGIAEHVPPLANPLG